MARNDGRRSDKHGCQSCALSVQISPLASCTLCVLLAGAQRPCKAPRAAAAVRIDCLLQAAESWSNEPITSALREGKAAVQR